MELFLLSPLQHTLRVFRTICLTRFSLAFLCWPFSVGPLCVSELILGFYWPILKQIWVKNADVPVWTSSQPFNLRCSGLKSKDDWFCHQGSSALEQPAWGDNAHNISDVLQVNLNTLRAIWILLLSFKKCTLLLIFLWFLIGCLII